MFNGFEDLPLDQIKFVERCGEARHGEILQFGYENQRAVGMRTFVDTPTGGAEGVLLIGGGFHGLLMTLEAIRNPSALIITHLVRFAASKPAPFIVDRNGGPTGALLLEPKTGAFLASGLFQYEDVKLPAFVYLTAENENTQAGAYTGTINPTRWRGIAKQFTLEPLP